MNVADAMRIRRWSKLKYINPRKHLIELGKIEEELARAKMDHKVRALRTNKLKRHREMYEAALFCHGLGGILGTTVYVARCEEDGYDFITIREDADQGTYTPLQIKELVPNTLNPTATLDGLVEGLNRYAAAEDTVIAIHVNRRMKMDLSSVKVRDVKVGEIWLFGGADQVPNQVALYGDLLQEPRLYGIPLPRLEEA